MSTKDDRNTAVLEYVRKELEKDFEVSPAVLHEGAQKIDESIGTMGLRSFNGRYFLSVKRAMKKQKIEAGEIQAPEKEKKSGDAPKKRGRPRKSTTAETATTPTPVAVAANGNADPRVTGILLAFANDILSQNALMGGELISMVNQRASEIASI